MLAAAAALLSQAPPARSAPLFQAALPVVPVPNMVAYWPLDAAVASVTSDLSGNANNGTLQPGALIDAVNKAAVPPGNPASLAITGASNQIVIVPDSASLSFTGSFTLAAWIRPTAAPGGTQRGIIEKWDWSGTYAQNGYMMRLDASNYLSFAVCGATGNIGISTAPRTVSSAGGWTHVAGTYDSTSGNMIMYVGGAADPTTGNAAGASPANGISELHLGGDYGSNRFAGNIDEARIYTRALTQPEIMILINGQPAPTGLVAAGQPGQINLTWTAAAGATTYSLLRGTASGTYTTVVNGIAGTTYNDTTATPGTPYFYVVVAVSVMTSNPSNQSSATAAPAGPPPPPPPPRTQQVGNGKGMCGCSTVTPAAMPWGTLGALLAAAMFLALPRRGARKA
ncbi:MAG: LamG domain-containing protein [Planctomycetes bacterium]|nr:LamG domain-containing protein [Planctomycetota bacterium]